MDSSQENEIKFWVEKCLKKKFTNFEISNLKYPEKGEGAMGDIIFVDLKAATEANLEQEYNLALKCSKTNEILREKSPLILIFHHETHMYQNVIKEFTKFQLKRGIENLFDSVPKYYGHYFGDNREVIALENVRAKGYDLWEKSEPMTRNHIELVLKEYAKFHAISAAMIDQVPHEFEKLTQPFDDFVKNLINQGNSMISNFCGVIEEVYELLQGELDEQILMKWRNFGKKLETNFTEWMYNNDGLKVVTHGDCWNNNFLFYSESNDPNQPTKVSILDWQFSMLNSPIFDLSHFLFSCLSEEDLLDLDNLLDVYYENFVDHLVKMKSDENLYSKAQFLEDWRRYSRGGFMMVPMVLKICTLEKGEGVDIGDAAEKGDYANAFMFKVKNTEKFVKRIKPILKYVVENELI